ncbi:MAG: hypothetical protein Unbinned5081contig1002_36 [Prokaryotic dsDNA virus sp.]|nr:MAG: hypothetical protein Unbinned5081contig1002_36 [Prokaryotic dsDNA virus sp.]
MSYKSIGNMGVVTQTRLTKLERLQKKVLSLKRGIRRALLGLVCATKFLRGREPKVIKNLTSHYPKKKGSRNSLS